MATVRLSGLSLIPVEPSDEEAIRRWYERLDIDSVGPAVLARLDAQARARSAGYSLVQWVGSTPLRHRNLQR